MRTPAKGRLLPGVVWLAAVVWLLWAFPRLHPATRLGLRFDRAGYLAEAARAAALQHVDVTGWSGYVKAEPLPKNQLLHVRMPGERLAQFFPDANVLTNFLPGHRGAGAKITLRPDGQPLAWKLPAPPARASPSASSTMAVASDVMHRMAGAAAAQYELTRNGDENSHGGEWRWNTVEPANVPPGRTPQVTIEVSVKNGMAWQTNTGFTLPESVRGRDRSGLTKVIAGSVWFVLLLAAVAIALLRDGAGMAVRSMKDRSVMVLGVAAAIAVFSAGLFAWNDDMISEPEAVNRFTEALGLLVGGVMVGLLFYLVSAATVLNARLHPASVRGFRLLGTRAFFSRTTGAELFGGWLFAPVFIAAPLLVAAVMRQPLFGGFQESLILSRFPILDTMMHAGGQETAGYIGLLGILFPLALRSRSVWLRRGLIAAFAFVTFAMLEAPFRDSSVANLVSAAVSGLSIVWIYSRFGMLGALSGHCGARILTSAGVLLVQPSGSLHASGWGILAAFAALGLVALASSLRGPEVVAELYGESGVRLQARSRREELLAEFNVARSAQRQMLPAEPPAIAGYTVAASCQPAREVGGDLYDFLRFEDGRWGIGVADVSGKGVPAALYMTLTKGLLRAAAQESDDPQQILGAVNRHLRTVAKRKMFVTMALGVLDPETRRMEYVRAGHNPVVWRRAAARETRFLAGKGIGLGISGPALFAKTLNLETIELAPGDALVFYSDGLTEAMDEGLEQFGDERLAAAVERADGMQAAATRDSILEEVKQFLRGIHPQDDLTIAVLRVDADISNGRN